MAVDGAFAPTVGSLATFLASGNLSDSISAQKPDLASASFAVDADIARLWERNAWCSLLGVDGV